MIRWQDVDIKNYHKTNKETSLCRETATNHLGKPHEILLDTLLSTALPWRIDSYWIYPSGVSAIVTQCHTSTMPRDACHKTPGTCRNRKGKGKRQTAFLPHSSRKSAPPQKKKKRKKKKRALWVPGSLRDRWKVYSMLSQNNCWTLTRGHGVVPKGLLAFLGSLYEEGAKTTSGTLVYRFERQTERKKKYIYKKIFPSFQKQCPQLRM